MTHSKKQKSPDHDLYDLKFIDIGSNKLACNYCPSSTTIKYWFNKGSVTDIISILPLNSQLCTSIKEQCKVFNINWHHIEVTHTKKFTKSFQMINNKLHTKQIQNLNNLLKIIKQIIKLLKTKGNISRKFVVHCKHGQHRTGIVMHLILRGLGCNKEESLNLIKEIRPITFNEMIKYRAPNKWFKFDTVHNLADFTELIIKHNNDILDCSSTLKISLSQLESRSSDTDEWFAWIMVQIQMGCTS
eukprot:287976_1